MAIDNYPKPRLPISNAMWRYNAVGGETTLSGYDSFGQPLQYTVNSEQLFLNGVMLVRNVDYTASTGSTITGLTALSAGDFVEILTYSNFNVTTIPAPNITGSIVNSQLNKSSIVLGGVTINLGDTVSTITGLTIDGTNNTIHINRGATNPSTGNVVGDIFWNTTSNAFQVYNGSSWTSFAAPAAPTIGTATDIGTSRAYNNAAASISFTPSNAAGVATQYYVTSTPGSLTSYGTTSPIIIGGLTSGTSYTFNVTAQGSFGSSPASSSTGSLTPTSVPSSPTISTATAGVASASVSFTAPSYTGPGSISYTVTSSPGGLTGTGSSSPITVSGLSPSSSYTFTVTATNTNGTSAPSSGSNSITPLAVSVNYLIVAGGGSGAIGQQNGNQNGGGGGAGGMLTGTSGLFPGSSFSITVGAGAAACAGSGIIAGNSGNPSSFNGISVIGGGAGGGGMGGSGGGGYATTPTGGSGTSGQGNVGGNSGGYNTGAGGGGGAGGAGASNSSGNGGAGGAGLASSISGSSVTYAGGGGGSRDSNNGSSDGAGGSGGGGAAGNGSVGNGTPNTGGGGGGSINLGTGSTGGSGIVIISYPNTYQNLTTIPVGLTYSGPVNTVGNKVYTFTAGTGTVVW
jgi:hypothetical protein